MTDIKKGTCKTCNSQHKSVDLSEGFLVCEKCYDLYLDDVFYGRKIQWSKEREKYLVDLILKDPDILYSL